MSRSNDNAAAPSGSRREFLKALAYTTALPAVSAIAATRPALRGMGLLIGPSGAPLARAAGRLDLDDLAHRAFRYFWEQADPGTGLVLDRARLDHGPDEPHHANVASIAATGFGLTALAIAAERGWIDGGAARQRARATLRFFARRAEQMQGWFFHFLDASTGRRAWQSELSSIDSALLLAGALTVGAAFADDREIAALADAIYARMDFRWMLAGDARLLCQGWTPERGFLPYRWDTYNEATILYLFAIGAPRQAIAPASWYAWKRPWIEFQGYRYVAGARPLLIHQYSHAWVDYRHRRERRGEHLNYFENSIIATRAQRAFCQSLHDRFPDYGPEHWGITASESAHGYVAWGGPPFAPDIDGSLVPCAAAGSLMFSPEICRADLEAMLRDYGAGLTPPGPAGRGGRAARAPIWGRYGFCDAFNPLTGWASPNVLGIDQGITLLSAENARSGAVWRWFMTQEAPRRALELVGLAREGA